MSRQYTTQYITAQRGFTLIELMVALVIGLILLAGVLQIFLSSRNTYRVQTALGRIQQESRFALDTLSRELRMLGYQGCSGNTTLQPQVIADSDGDGLPDLDYSRSSLLTGYDAGSGWVNPTAITAQSGSDVFSFIYGDGNTARLSGNMASDNANVQITHNPMQLSEGDTAMISDCINADIFTATSVSQTGGSSVVTVAHAENRNIGNRLSKAYGPDAMLLRVRRHTYFIGTEANQPSLYRVDINGTPQRLVEGVEAMRVLYGENTDAGTDRPVTTYNTAAQVTDWSRVVSLRLALLLRSDSEVAPSPQTYNYRHFANAAPTDRYLRRELVISINLRNRMP